MLVVDMHEVEDCSKQLDTFKRSVLPAAIRESLNRSAFAGRRVWDGEIRGSMILRNNWTTGSLRVVKASGSNVSGMQSVLGSSLDYLAKDESGGLKGKRGKFGVAIPTTVASGEGRGIAPRRRLVRGPNKLGAIHLGKRIGNTPKQRNAVAIRQAIASGKRFAFLELQRSKGLFRITGGKRKHMISMVWDTSRKTVRIPRIPTLGNTIQRLTPHLPAIHLGVLRERLARARILGF